VHDTGGVLHVAPARTSQSVGHVAVHTPHQHTSPDPHSAVELHVSNQFVLLPPAWLDMPPHATASV
jgi:hypothetical protein